MNAPLTDAVRQALEKVSLDDKYALPTGRAFMSGCRPWCACPCCSAPATRWPG
jgi:indolepyruvate ferredoxin oxidoreductase